jgi:hypothetical protein
MKISLYSNELLSLKNKSAYINSFYRDFNEGKRKTIDGFIVKFNNSIGFKPVIDMVKESIVIKKTEENPNEYIAPSELLFNNIETPVESFDIAVFYISKKDIIHTKQEYSYNTYDIGDKWKNFLEKVFPNLLVKIEYVNKRPKLSLRDYAFQYFYNSIHEIYQLTIEFSSRKKLKDVDIAYILPKLQTLSKERISIAQFECKACLNNSKGKDKFHIEIVYLSRNGKDQSEEAYKNYGNSIYKV